MNDILQDYSNYIIGFISLLISVILALYIYSKQRQLKSLVYSIESYYDLVAREAIGSGLKILYDNKELTSATVLVLQVQHTGNTPITKNDFEKTFDLVFSNNTSIFKYKIEEQIPSNLIIDCSVETNVLKLSPFLLNPGEKFKIKLLVGDNEAFDFDFRISGVSKIERKENEVTPVAFLFSKEALYFWVEFILTVGPVYYILYAITFDILLEKVAIAFVVKVIIVIMISILTTIIVEKYWTRKLKIFVSKKLFKKK